MTQQGIPEGWVQRRSKAFGTHVGPFYQPPEGGETLCGFLADERHGNKRGVVHGGMLATAFDVALGNASWESVGQRPCATIQLNIHFIGALQLGEFAQVQADITRSTRSLVFLRGTMRVDDRIIATADGVWKILQWRGEAFVPG